MAIEWSEGLMSLNSRHLRSLTRRPSPAPCPAPQKENNTEYDERHARSRPAGAKPPLVRSAGPYGEGWRSFVRRC